MAFRRGRSDSLVTSGIGAGRLAVARLPNRWCDRQGRSRRTRGRLGRWRLGRRDAGRGSCRSSGAARRPEPDEAEFLGLTEAQHVLEVDRIAYADELPVETVVNVFPSQQWRLAYEWPAK
jgi:hypothetical protein